MEGFIAYLRSQDRSQHTIDSYAFAIRQLEERTSELSDSSLLGHKDWLTSSFSAKTANLRISAINCYLDFIGYKGLRLKGLRIQQKPFLDNVISQHDYELMRDGTLRDGELYWHFVVRFLTCTGARVSELRMFTVRAVEQGHLDIVSKGQKLRRIYLPARLQDDAEAWLESESRSSGFVFVGPGEEPMTARGLSLGLKRCAKRYGVDPDLVYPHSFRHRFAKNFIAKDPDIAFLADLMGHENIETTRIYLRRTAEEQRAAVDAAIDW